MSPALNGSSEIWRFEPAYAIEIRDGIMFVFYPGLPHIEFHKNIAQHVREKTRCELRSPVKMMIFLFQFQLLFFPPNVSSPQVAKEIWVCQKQGVHPWPGDIQSYKAALKKKAMKYLGRK